MTRFEPKKKEFRRSQKWTQVLINDKPALLNEILKQKLNIDKSLEIKWLSPLKSDFYAEYRGSRSKK